MTNPETKQQYEGARKASLSQSSRSTTICATRCLNQLVKNAEKLAVIELKFRQITPKIEKIDVLEMKIDAVEQKVDRIYSALSTLKWISVTIGIGVIINIFSQPVLDRIF